MTQKRPNIDNKRHHLILLAKNEIGYKNLLKIVTASYLEGYYYKPRTDKNFLRKHSEGLIALSACMAGGFQNDREERSGKSGKGGKGI